MMRKLWVGALCALVVWVQVAAATVAAFPVAGYLNNAARTNAEMKQALEDFLAATKQLPGGADATTLTISSGAVSVAQTCHKIETEGGAGSDYLYTLGTAMPQGSVVVLQAANAARTVVVGHGTGVGGMLLSGSENFSMSDVDMFIVLVLDGTSWREMGREYGADVVDRRLFLKVLSNVSPVWTGQGYSTALLLTNTGQPTLAAIDNALTLGPVATFNLAMGPTMIQARNNGAAADLHLNYFGTGTDVYIHGGKAWHQGNDGSGSGLDADIVDGLTPASMSDPGVIVCRHWTATGGGGTATTTTWTAFNSGFAEQADTRSLCSVSAGVMTVTDGLYEVDGWHTFYCVNGAQVRLYDVTNGAVLLTGQTVFTDNESATPIYRAAVTAAVQGVVTVENGGGATTQLKWEYYVANSTGSEDLGVANNFTAGGGNVHGVLTLRRLTN